VDSLLDSRKGIERDVETSAVLTPTFLLCVIYSVVRPLTKKFHQNRSMYTKQICEKKMVG
jgi:hypothetical protein